MTRAIKRRVSWERMAEVKQVLKKGREEVEKKRKSTRRKRKRSQEVSGLAPEGNHLEDR